MRDVAIVSFAQLPSVQAIDPADESELVQPVTSEAMRQVGLTQDDIGFTCSGSSGRRVWSGAGRRAMCPWTISTGLSPVKGGRPVSAA